MKKCIHLIPVDGVGGVETAARSFINRRDLLAGPVELKVMYVAQSRIKNSALAANPGVLGSGFRSVNNPVAYLSTLLKLLKEKPDVLICSLWRTMPIGLMVKLLLPKSKLVCFLHSMKSMHLSDKVLNELTMQLSDAIWGDSDSTLQFRIPHRLKLSKRTRTISFLLEKYSQQLPPRNSGNFVYWGRLHHLKGVDRALHFFAALAKQHPEVEYYIFGPDDGEEQRLKELSRQLGISDRVRFMGVTSFQEMKRNAHRFSYYLQLSRCEGMAISVMEAMQLGLVPVVSPVGEIANYCNAGNAVVVADPETPTPYLSELSTVLSNDRLYEKLQAGSLLTWRGAAIYSEDILAALSELP